MVRSGHENLRGMGRTMRRCKAPGCTIELQPAAKCSDIIEKKGFCSVECLASSAKDKRITAQAKAERKATQLAREKLKTRTEYLRDAQRWFNKWIRLRDAGEPCISCGKPSKKENAGHYRSTGAAPELRFEPLNVHLQCEHCNTYLSSNAIDYRINLIKKIGVDKVEWIEGLHAPKKYTIADAKAIKAQYKSLCAEMESNKNSD